MISMYYNHDYENLGKDWMAQNSYYPYDFEVHKNLSHKQLWLTVYYFMDGAVP